MNPEIIKLHEKERFSKPYWKSSRYYDYPDGQDLIGKLIFTNQVAWVAGSFMGLWSASCYRPVPTSWNGKLIRYFQCVGPALGMATAFTCVTYFSTNIRKKDDEINYLLGALAAAASLILPTRNGGYVTVAAVHFCVLAYLQKYSKMRNKNLLGNPGHKFMTPYYSRLYNSSLEPDTRRGNWTK